jgi:hypothetical protein
MMSNLRGLLMRLWPSARRAVDAAVYGAWALSILGLAGTLWRRRVPDEDPPRETFALAITTALVFSPHLFPQDVMLIVTPCTLKLAALRDRGDPWRPFAAFVLAWPPLYLVARLADLTATPLAPFRAPLDPVFVGLLTLLALVAHRGSIETM